ncbi:phosphate ABC transporter permease PstA [Vibrio sp. SM6]|uniref:Phosphate transport system permease protein PstA n=1 Tax=Vibrio agarilyticus TaxID=2726741 RepID=A0A7X8TNW1_9VIBR|nr:phosphate ABC transporter permease PstA [Vibrio agarilyticus]NLS12015.1 phosphate ABC transporter permease PstA [Vibrio agarilyticus]
MTDDPLLNLARTKQSRLQQSLTKRRRAERRFRYLGMAAIASALLFLVVMVGAIVKTGVGAFWVTQVRFEFPLSDTTIPSDARQMIRATLRNQFGDVTSRAERRQLYQMISPEAEFQLSDAIASAKTRPDATRLTLWLPAGDRVNQYRQHHAFQSQATNEHSPSSHGDTVAKKAATSQQVNAIPLTQKQIQWYGIWQEQQRVRMAFNWAFFTSGDSRNPAAAGIASAFVGSFLTLLTTLVLSFPIGVGAAIYLEEYAPKNRITDLIEININNLAAVPSIVFGLLGLAIFLNVLGMPRSTPLVGGLVLTLMTLPTIIISSRAALKAVPPSIRDAALAMGASRTQTVFHHVVPLALPGMLTGSIIGMAQALGETAPLLMIGMVAFIVEVPHGLLDAATALPVQIFLWSENPERGFSQLTSAAIMVLLLFLFLMNAFALFLRRKLERKW